MQKFVTVASVIAMDGDVVILDKPTAGQDSVGFKILTGVLDDLQNRGKTVITVIHDMEFVAEHFERLIVMANRRISPGRHHQAAGSYISIHKQVR